MSWPPPNNYSLLGLFQLVPFLLVVFVFGVFGDWCNPWLEYNRTALLQKWHVWRLISGHLVHLGLIHSLLNLTGLVLVLHLFKGVMSAKQWWLSGLISAMAISLGFIVLKPQLLFYAGLSGVIHGLLVQALLLEIFKPQAFQRWLSLVVLAGVFAKLAYEQMPGYDVNYLQAHMQAPVIVDAHLYGAVIGVFLAAAFGLVKRR